MICIYCSKNEREISFKCREHVVPQSFGKFNCKTPTIHCVCDECNHYFSKELDQKFARDTIEGITRYKKGIFSRERQFPKSLRFELEETEEKGEYGGVILGGYDPTTGDLLPPVPQFWMRNIKKDKWEKYDIEEIKNISITDQKYGPTTPGGRQMKVMASSEGKYKEVLEELKKYNIPYREKEIFGQPAFLKNVNAEGKIELKGTIQGTVDKVRKRALVKILFNFATYYIGVVETSKSEWDKARDFVRCDGDTLPGRMSQKPFWDGQETKNMRFASDSYNIRIENQKGNVVGVIQFYNLFTYEFILVENYSLPREKEVAYRFTPGQEPIFGVKMTKPKLITEEYDEQ